MITILKYGNRKLYNKEASAYTTVDAVMKLREGTFQVICHKTKLDITNKVILDALCKKASTLSVSMIGPLRNLIAATNA